MNLRGPVAQLVRAPPCHGGGRRFEPDLGRRFASAGRKNPRNDRGITILYGWVPEWPKGTDCKSAANCFGGSNPPPPISESKDAFGFIFFDVAGWSSLEARRAHNPKVGGSNPPPATYAQVAQLVEQRTENPRVAGSIPALGIFLCPFLIVITAVQFLFLSPGSVWKGSQSVLYVYPRSILR